MKVQFDRWSSIFNFPLTILVFFYMYAPLPIIVCSTHDNSRLVSGGADKVVIITDVGTGQSIRKFRGHMGVSVVNHPNQVLGYGI